MADKWKTVRLFVSSTFRDMQSERDHLVRFAFPRLREYLLGRRIHLVDVDLRWGIVGEEDVTDMCREIIDECHPYFIGILGGRYGYVPPARARSITADEIHYAALSRGAAERGFVSFYFRDDDSTRQMVEREIAEFREPSGSARERQLEELKAAIVAAGVTPFTYTASWDDEHRRLRALSPFGDRVCDDVLARIKEDRQLRDRFTAPTSVVDTMADEDDAMATFVQVHAEGYVLGSREPLLRSLLDHAESDAPGNYVCITGPPGSGKSSLLAHLVDSLEGSSSTSPQVAAIVISHFVGASRGSTDLATSLRRMCRSLKQSCDEIADDVPGELAALVHFFRECLRRACLRRRVVMVVDGVEHLKPAAYAPALDWLPPDPPLNARVILSIATADESEADSQGEGRNDIAIVEEQLRRLGARARRIEPLTEADRRSIVRAFCARYRKSLDRPQEQALIAKPDAGTPLYIVAALQELRTLGVYEEITARIAELPPTVSRLFAWIMNRLEEDDGFRDAAGQKVGTRLVGRLMRVLAASRHGLSHRELRDLVDPGDPLGNVAALLHLLRPYLMNRGDLTDFYHRQFRLAASNVYMNDPEDRRRVHGELADYFERQPATRRKVEELPWQLQHAEQWTRLADAFEDVSLFDEAWRLNRFEVAAYWAQVERHSHRRLVDLAPLWAKVSIDADNVTHVWNAARVLEDSGHPDEAFGLWEAIIQYAARAGDQARLGGALGNAAIRLKDRGELETALVLFKEQERICVATGDQYGLQNAVGNQGLIAAGQGRFDEAMGLHRRKEEICRAIGHKVGIAAALGNQALVVARHDPRAALALHEQEAHICRSIGDQAGIGRAARNRGLICERLKQPDRALVLFRESEQVYRAAGHKIGVLDALMDQVRVLQRVPDLHHALEKCREAEALYRTVADKKGLAACLYSAARIHLASSQPIDALDCLDEAQDVFSQIGYSDGFEGCVLNRAIAIAGWDAERALDLLQEQESRLRQSGQRRHLMHCLLTQVPLLMQLGALTRGLEKATDAERLCTELDYAPGLSLCRELRSQIVQRGVAESR
jgi:tetratricopeptide (TPR) repeat protein